MTAPASQSLDWRIWGEDGSELVFELITPRGHMIVAMEPDGIGYAYRVGEGAYTPGKHNASKDQAAAAKEISEIAAILKREAR